MPSEKKKDEISHMERVEFALNITDDNKMLVLQMQGFPQICCVECCINALGNFVDQSKKNQEKPEKDLGPGVH